MKKFTINCDFGGQMAPFTIYIGQPERSHHPLHFQADWLSKERGGTVPAEVMDAIAKLKDLAEKNNVSLEELCVYALGSAQEDEAETEDSKNSKGESEIEQYSESDESYDAEENSSDEDTTIDNTQSDKKSAE